MTGAHQYSDTFLDEFSSIVQEKIRETIRVKDIPDEEIEARIPEWYIPIKMSLSLHSCMMRM